MGKQENITKDEVLKANVELHTQLANVYNKDEPHWRSENIKIVRDRIQEIMNRVGHDKMLDIGCGTGFMVEVARPLKPKYILGVDITPAMIEQVDKSGLEKVDLHLGDAGNIPVDNNFFDFATAYSFIDHLYDIDTVFSEVNRCLKNNGVFYAGLIPNEYFWDSINTLKRDKVYSAAITREIIHTSDKDKEMNSVYGVNKDVFNKAEYQKNIMGGLSEPILTEKLYKAGFKKVEFYYDWFLGQGLINNDPKKTKDTRESEISIISNFLEDNLPITKSLFKYISFFATK